MPDKPAAEIEIDERLVRRLLMQASVDVPDAATRRVRRIAEGWDCSVWAIGADLAMRLPRRALAAVLIRHEAQALPLIGPAIEASGIRVPLPVFVGEPEADYPWSWSLVPWIAGSTGLSVPRAERSGWATPLARALEALHVPAPAGHPVSPVRGVPLALRADAFRNRLASLRASGRVAEGALDHAEAAWTRGLAAEPWTSDPVWVHGDLHPGNLVAHHGMLRGIIDFGDVTGGDPAYDLAVAWLAFDASGRRSFLGAIGDRYSAATWIRARAWAAAVGILLLSQSDDDPVYATLGAESLHEVSGAADS